MVRPPAVLSPLPLTTAFRSQAGGPPQGKEAFAPTGPTVGEQPGALGFVVLVVWGGAEGAPDHVRAPGAPAAS